MRFMRAIGGDYGGLDVVSTPAIDSECNTHAFCQASRAPAGSAEGTTAVFKDLHSPADEPVVLLMVAVPNLRT